jgi:HK97 family phage prohead protease
MLLNRISTESRAEKVSDRTYKFVISDESVDRHGTIIKMAGWDLSNYEKNGIVAYQHNTFSDDPDMIVGKGRAWVDGSTLYGEVEFEPEGSNPIADKLVKKLEFGSIRATSVGFNPSEWSRGISDNGEDNNVIYFRKQELLEWSIVNIPSNPNATISKSYDDFVGLVKQELSEQNEITESKGLDEHTSRLLRLRISTL